MTGDAPKTTPAGRTSGWVLVALVAAALAAILLRATAVGWLRLNHADFLFIEGRLAESRRLADDVARTTSSAWARHRASVFAFELSLLGVDPPARSLPADAPPLLEALAAYLALAGDDDIPPAPEGAVAIPPHGLMLLGDEAPLLAGALSLRRGRRWAALYDLLAGTRGAPRALSGLRSRPLLEPMLVRAAFETARWERLEEVLTPRLRGGIAHPDFVGPAVRLLPAAGRGDELLLALHRLRRSGRLPSEPTLKAFAGGPAGGAGVRWNAAEADFAPSMLQWLADPRDPALIKDLIPPSWVMAYAPPALRDSRAWARASVAPGAPVVILGDPLAGTELATFNGAGTLELALRQPVPWGRVKVVVRARGTLADGEWPVLLLRVDGESHSEIYVCAGDSRDFVRQFEPRGTLQSLSLTYTNNAVADPAAGDRNVYVADVFLGPGDP